MNERFISLVLEETRNQSLKLYECLRHVVLKSLLKFVQHGAQ